MKLNNVNYLTLPQQVEVNRKKIEKLLTEYSQVFTTKRAIKDLTYLNVTSLTDIKHKPVIGDLIYGSDSYYAQITGAGESIVEFVVIGQIANNNTGLDRKYIALPSDFEPTLPFDLYRSIDSKIYHNFDFNTLKQGVEIYVDLILGNDTSGNGAYNTPFKTIKKALQIIYASPDGSYQIIVKSNKPFFRDEGWETGSLKIYDNKKISIYPENEDVKIINTSGARSLSWTEDGVGTWTTNRSLVRNVIDFRDIDANGSFIPYQNVGTLLECQGTPRTWFTDGTSVWVHTSDNLMPIDDNMAICLEVQTLSIRLTGNSSLYIENMILAGDTEPASIYGNNSGVVEGKFIAKNCVFIGGNLLTETSGNAISVTDVKEAYLFDCIASYAFRDGFNYHYYNIPTQHLRSCIVFEYNNIAYNCGLNDTNNNNNATSAHEGVSVLRVNSIGYNTNGPTCIDVDGCYSLLYDCQMMKSNTSQNYSFSGVNGKVYLENCISIDPQLQDLGLDSNVKVIINRFYGNSINNYNNIIFK